MKLTRMNSALGKQIISLIRKGDYAHPGGEEAIKMVFEDVPKNADRLLLDVGSGLAGTANYLQEKGYGIVTGIEIDEGIIKLAKSKYPHLNLVQTDVNQVDTILENKFDLIYHFCSFYAFSEKFKALKALRNVSHGKTELIIFDYAICGNIRKSTDEIPHPLNLKEMETMFSKSSWKQVSCIDISDYYKNDYANFTAKIKENKEAIIELSDPESYEYVLNKYEEIYKDYCNKSLLAVILKAIAD